MTMCEVIWYKASISVEYSVRYVVIMSLLKLVPDDYDYPPTLLCRALCRAV